LRRIECGRAAEDFVLGRAGVGEEEPVEDAVRDCVNEKKRCV